MQDGASSGTAAYVAFLRALGDAGLTSATGFRDPVARKLLPAPWPSFVRLAPLVARLPQRHRERVVAHVDLFVCRSLAIDAELASAVSRGCTQVVILGAGFDDRAHRMTALAGTDVFEVDHPATQKTKQRAAARVARTCRGITYVPCDFARDALADRLGSAGHRRDEPSAWVWEGVTLYLGDAAIHDTLAVIGARSSPGSSLVVEYHDSEAPALSTLYTRTRRLLLDLWSEPQIGGRSRSTMHRELERARLHVERDFAISDWGVETGATSPNERTRAARLAVARVRP